MADDPPWLADMLKQFLRESRLRWPGVALDELQWRAYVAERVASEGATPHVDLYLACACAAGDTPAMVELEREFFREVDQATARLDGSGQLADEVKQLLRMKLFVGEHGAAGKITEYRGRGSLGAWLRVVATRTALNVLRQGKPAQQVDDRLPDNVDDVELAYLKRTYRQEFKESFTVAFAKLEPQQRNLLRLFAIDGLSITQIAQALGLHRTTASRQMTAAREALASATKMQLMTKLDVGGEELESILRMIRSRLDVSLREYVSKTDT